jgi:hypothetical protein
MAGELVAVQPPPMTVASLKERAQHVQLLIKDLMVEGVHYGVVPGTKDRSLTKQGAEMLLSAFHIAIEPEIIENHDADAVRYTVKARGVHMGSGAIIGVGIGRCSSNEEKYKWRRAVCLAEFEATPEDRRRIKWGKGDSGVYTVQQVRTNPDDLANTVLKMAKKRAQADLCLTALAASDAFKTQPRPENTKGSGTNGKPASTTTPPNGNPSKTAGTAPSGETPQDKPRPATSSQVALITRMLDQVGVSETYFLEQFELARFEELPASQVDAALKWIRSQQQEPPP